MRIFFNQAILGTLFVLLLTACNTNASQGNEKNTSSTEKVETSQKKKVEVFEVAETQAFCEQMAPRKCLQVKRENKKKHQLFYDRIENFRFISGYRYVLKVEVEKMKFAPKDTSGYKYYLKEIVKREKVKNPDKNANLYLSKWLLTHINGEKIEKNRAFVVFNKTKGSFYGNSGCNSMSGKFKLVKDVFSVSGIRLTRRACPGMQNVESPFTSNLNSADKIKAEIDRLYFYKNNKVVLEFKSNWKR